jgi:hypothetical protein
LQPFHHCPPSPARQSTSCRHRRRMRMHLPMQCGPQPHSDLNGNLTSCTPYKCPHWHGSPLPLVPLARRSEHKRHTPQPHGPPDQRGTAPSARGPPPQDPQRRGLPPADRGELPWPVLAVVPSFAPTPTGVNGRDPPSRGGSDCGTHLCPTKRSIPMDHKPLEHDLYLQSWPLCACMVVPRAVGAWSGSARGICRIDFPEGSAVPASRPHRDHTLLMLIT